MSKRTSNDENDRIAMEQPPDKKDETFNGESVSSSPIGRLMDDTPEPAEEQRTYVSGFERGNPEEAAMPSELRSKRERPTQPEAEEDFFETGIREARAGRDRDRRRRSNPDPRPAVRATIPTPRRMTVPPTRHDDTGSRTTVPPPEDRYDTFRQRYNPDELISTNRGARPQRRAGQPTRENPAGGGIGSGSVRYAEDENERVSMIRWGLLAGIIVVFAFIIFLLASRASINNRYREARDTIASMEAAYARYNSLSREAEALEEENESLQREVNSLQSQLAALGAADNVVPDDNNIPPTIGSETTPSDTTPEPPTLPVQHTITRGQTLISIARMHYGPGVNHAEDLARAQHIASYNNIPNIDAIQLDQTITIPPLP